MVPVGDWNVRQEVGSSSAEDSPPESLLWQDPSTPLRISRLGDLGGGDYRLRMGPELAVDCLSGGQIVARPGSGLPQHSIDHFLADQVIPRLVAHRGSLVIHAGAVQAGDSAIMFVGESGRGKSTLTASFGGSGLPFLGDDAMILSVDDHVPSVRAVYPSLRLFPDSIEALMPAGSAAGPVAHYSTKQRIDVAATNASSAMLPIAAICAIVAPADNMLVAIRPLSVADACMILVRNSFALDPNDRDRARRRMTEASAVAACVPAFEIAYPRDYARLPEVRRAILDQVAALEPA